MWVKMLRKGVHQLTVGFDDGVGCDKLAGVRQAVSQPRPTRQVRLVAICLPTAQRTENDNEGPWGLESKAAAL